MNKQQQKIILPILVVLAILFTGCGNTTAKSETATTTAPATESAVTEAPETNAPETEAPATEAPATEAPTTDWTVQSWKILTSPTGKLFNFEECDWIEIIYFKGSRALIKEVVDFYPNYLVRIKVVDDLTGKVTCISSDDHVILDVHNANNTVYWYTANRDVWACHWHCSRCEEICTPVLFCQDAIGLSPYVTDLPGAVVPDGKGNWPFSEMLEILTPHGEGGNFKNPEPCWD